MARGLFPERIETDRLLLEPLAEQDPFEVYDLVTSDGWRPATEHMPWFRFDRLDEVADFLEAAEEQWADRDTARYAVRLADDGERSAGSRSSSEPRSDGGTLIGTTAYGPEWDQRRAGSGIVLAEPHWGNEYGLERASAFVELTFERYDLDAYYTTCAADNEPSRRMIEKYVQRYGGRHEGLLRQHSERPDGSVTDQHRFTILREEYEAATADRDTLAFDLEW